MICKIQQLACQWCNRIHFPTLVNKTSGKVVILYRGVYKTLESVKWSMVSTQMGTCVKQQAGAHSAFQVGKGSFGWLCGRSVGCSSVGQLLLIQL